MTKILFINNHYYPEIGGTEKIAQTILEHFAKKPDFQCFVKSLYPKDRPSLEKGGVHISRQGSFPGLIRDIVALQPDYIHLNSVFMPRNLAFLFLYFFYLRWRHLKAQVILNPIRHFSLSYYLKKNFAIRILEFLGLPIQILLSLLCNFADKLIYVDKKNRNYEFDRWLIQSHKIQIISQGVETDFIDQCISSSSIKNVKKKYTIPFDHYDICVSNLFPTKNHIDLIRFYQKSKRNLICVFSENPQDRGIRKKLEAMASPNVLLLEGLPRCELFSIMNAADLHISFSYVEGAQPNVMLECLYLGLPYLYTSNGQDYSYFPNSYHFKNWKSLTHLLSSDDWVHERKKITNPCKEYIRKNRMTWPEILSEYEKIFSKNADK